MVVGVSTATVSNALNDNGKTKPELRDRIVEVARQMNYVADTMAKGLKTRHTNTIGIISEDITSWNMGAIIDGIGECAEEHGFSLLLDNLRYTQLVRSKDEDHYDSPMNYSDRIIDLSTLLLRRDVDGIVYIGTHDWELRGLIDSIDRPVVYTYCYSVVASEDQRSMDYDDEGAACALTRHLTEKGHERIAAITGPLESLPAQKRPQRYERALREIDAPTNPEPIAAGDDWSFDVGQWLVRDLLGLADRPLLYVGLSGHRRSRRRAVDRPVRSAGRLGRRV